MEISILQYIQKWEKRCYANGIPDEVESYMTEKAPSYKKIALDILNNNFESYKKPKKSKYYSELKYKELKSKSKEIQLKLF